MIRMDKIDTGIWSDKSDKSKLIMPVDTHIYRISRGLKLVKRKSCDMKFAIELTEKFKKFDKKDPVKYDFALCHVGIEKAALSKIRSSNTTKNGTRITRSKRKKPDF